MAKPNFQDMTAQQLNDWYESTVGYRPQVDSPTMPDSELLELCISYWEAANEEQE